jgi:4-hydroxy-tetrahydrodipicolinate reductase
MKIALLGYGKMGKLIEELAAARGMELVLRLDEYNNREGDAITAENFRGVDVALDFSTPQAAIENIPRVVALGVNMVVGTTGWHEHIRPIQTLVKRHNTGLVYGSNFSVGVNVFYRIVAEAARAFKDQPDYDPWIHEMHHRMKLDAPSGTALKLRDALAAAYGERAINVSSARAGAVPGVHTVGFDSEADTITLTHSARSRKGFALGALYAAEWIHGRKGFYDFSEVLFGQK